MDDIDLEALASELEFVLKSDQKEAVRSLLKGRDVLVCCQQALEKAWYLRDLFSRKAELPNRQLQLKSNARQLILLSFIRSKANNIERRQTFYRFCATTAVDRAMWFEIFKRSRSLDTLQNKASKVSNLKCGWRCQRIFDTLVTLFELLVGTNSLYEKPTVVFSPLASHVRIALTALCAFRKRPKMAVLQSTILSFIRREGLVRDSLIVSVVIAITRVNNYMLNLQLTLALNFFFFGTCTSKMKRKED